MTAIIRIADLSKTYASGFKALKNINLEIKQGEIFALLGPNGGRQDDAHQHHLRHRPIRRRGTIRVDGKDIIADYRAVRAMIGLCAAGTLDGHVRDTRGNTVNFSRGFSASRVITHWSRRCCATFALGQEGQPDHDAFGRHETTIVDRQGARARPRILFLDEPTAGVDVELRREMWGVVRDMRARGVTIILTTHYIEEAEEMADRVGVIAKGEIILVEEKNELMRKLGKKQLVLQLQTAARRHSRDTRELRSAARADGNELIYTYDTHAERTGITALLNDMRTAGVPFKDLSTTQSSLEDIFVDLVRQKR